MLWERIMGQMKGNFCSSVPVSLSYIHLGQNERSHDLYKAGYNKK